MPYDYVEYVPMLVELPLRLRTHKLRGKITAPTLIDRGHVLGDSFEIARYAEEIGGRAPLFPSKACGTWNGASEAVMQNARGYYDAAYQRVAMAAGFTHLYTTEHGVVRAGVDLTRLPRLVAKDRGASWFGRRMSIYGRPWLSALYLGLKSGKRH